MQLHENGGMGRKRDFGIKGWGVSRILILEREKGEQQILYWGGESAAALKKKEKERKGPGKRGLGKGMGHR